MQKPSPVHIANAVRLKRQANGRVAAVVEAGGDGRFYRRFLQADACDFTFAFGKENALQVVSILENQGFSFFFGVVDPDFDRLNGLSPPSSNVIWADCHDLETMLIRSSALEKVLGELGSDEKLQQFEKRFGEIRRVLICAAAPLGYLRLHSNLAKLHLRFDGLRFSRFVDPQTLVIDINRLVTEVKNNSLRHGLDSLALRKAVSELEQHGHDLWEVCNGHDLAAILTLGLRQLLGSRRARGLTTEALELNLRIAYEAAAFPQTQVYQQLREWERRNGARILL